MMESVSYDLRCQKSVNDAVAPIKTQNSAMQDTDLVHDSAEESIVRHDYSNDIAKWQRNLKDSKKTMKYLLNRGLTEETILRFRLGYDEHHWQPKLQKEEPSIIIPYGNDNTYYIARTIDNKEFHKPSQKEAGLEPVFNCDSLYSDGNKPVFIVEGSLDAISIEQLGFKAVALSGTSHNPLMEQLRSKPTKSILVIALDNDEAGKTRSTKLRDELLHMGIRCVVENLTEGLGCKDANEALVKNPEELSIVLNRVADEQSITNEFVSDTLYLEKVFLKDQTQFQECKNIKTGFGLLDTRLGGGVFPGLHLIGASTSLGKTTFCHQMACHMASLGVKVLFFSLEMSRFQMVSRGIAREIAKGNSSNAISALEVRKGERKDQINSGIERYKNLAKSNLYTIDPKFGYTVEELIKCTGRFIEQNSGEPVVVFVDYLQILKVDANGRKEPQRREEIDSIVTKLKQFSDDYQIPVFVVSSLSRGNYMLPVSLESFKESGGIEYTADVVIGLQLKCFGDNTVFDGGESKINKKRDAIREAMGKNPREIELLILKNRNGAIGERLFYKYHSRYDLFDNEGTGNGGKMPGTNDNGF
jgi:replicative DNA helicase